MQFDQGNERGIVIHPVNTYWVLTECHRQYLDGDVAMNRRDTEGLFPHNISNLAGEPNNKEITTWVHMELKVTGAIRKLAGRDHDRETEFKRMGSGKMLREKWPAGTRRMKRAGGQCSRGRWQHAWESQGVTYEETKEGQCGCSSRNRRKNGTKGGWKRGWGRVKTLRFYLHAVGCLRRN